MGWRSRLTADEAYQLGLMDRGLARNKSIIASIQKARKAIINKAIQRNTRHLKKGVDTKKA